jgi:hypothetical protein
MSWDYKPHEPGARFTREPARERTVGGRLVDEALGRVYHFKALDVRATLVAYDPATDEVTVEAPELRRPRRLARALFERTLLAEWAEEV